jgi:tetratricopeptide (TPR) repeat protein
MNHSPRDLAEAFLKTGELQDALAAMQAHLLACPHDDEMRRLMAQTLLRLGQDEASLAAWQGIHTPLAEDAVHQATALLRLQRPGEAVERLQGAVADCPGDERLAERLVQVLMAQERYAEAYQAARAHTGWRWEHYLGDIAAALGSPDKAAGHYQAALAALESRNHGSTVLQAVAAHLRQKLGGL